MSRRAVVSCILALCLAGFGFRNSSADCPCGITQLQESGGFGADAPGGVGQSFLACADGSITSVQVLVNSLNSPPVIVGFQEGLGVSTAAYTQAATLAPGISTIALTTPFPVTTGSEYSFAVFATSEAFGLRSASGDPYPDGTFFFQEPDATPTFLSGGPDLWFTVQIEGCAAETGAPAVAASGPLSTHAYPNPARGDVTVRFELASATRAKVRIFTADGRWVATIADRFWTAGTREVRWDATDLTAGVYLYRIETPERTTGGKIVIRR